MPGQMRAVVVVYNTPIKQQMSQFLVSRWLPHSYAGGSDSFTAYVTGDTMWTYISPKARYTVLPSCKDATFIHFDTIPACDWRTDTKCS